jgi:transglutaminase-like putative cysteine protease
MPRGLLSIIAFLLIPLTACGQPPTHRIVAAEEQSVQARIGYEVRAANFIVTRWMLFMSEPPELPSQIKVKVTSEPHGKVIAEKSPIARKVRLFDVTVAKPAPGGKLALRQDIAAVLRSRTLVPLEPGEKPPAVPALTGTERKFYLGPTRHIDFDSTEFKAWLDAKKLTRPKSELALDFAGRVLGVIRSDFGYRFDPAEEKRASVSCQQPATDCGGMTILFVAAMRANDIPTRILVGRFAKPRRPGTTLQDLDFDQPHVRAEFHVPGIGWIPVDPSFANRDREKPIESFIGRDPGDMLVLHVDLELRLPVMDRELNADILQIEPFVWAVGRGKLDLMLMPSMWELKAIPIKKK